MRPIQSERWGQALTINIFVAFSIARRNGFSVARRPENRRMATPTTGPLNPPTARPNVEAAFCLTAGFVLKASAVRVGFGKSCKPRWATSCHGPPSPCGYGAALFFAGRKKVEAAGVEPASLAKLPAATTCLAGRESRRLDNLPTRIQSPKPAEKVSGKCAQTPHPP